MEPIKVKIKKLVPEAVIPSYSKAGDAGMDLVAITESSSAEHGFVEFGTGLSIEIPNGYVGLLFPRSSISTKSCTLANCVGVIDSNYRGEIKFRFKPDTSSIFASMWENIAENFKSEDYKIGDRIGQLIIIPYPHIDLEEVSELSDTERGTKGFGSSGN
jgi:dUTP pyrophosphatase